VVRWLARRYLWLRHRVFGRRYRRLVLEQVDGLALVVLPEVFNPALFRTGPFLAETFKRICPAGSVGQAALDLGTGSGLCALAAARAGFRAVGVDINPEAVRCARINALINRLEDRVEAREGDLFGPVAGERFDVVLFNPPFYRGMPRDALDHAWRGVGVFERFAAGLGEHLMPGGQALVVLSTDGDAPGMLNALRAEGYDPQPAAVRDLGNEVLTVYAVAPRP
jgi:HemK-related putative methylase